MSVSCTNCANGLIRDVNSQQQQIVCVCVCVCVLVCWCAGVLEHTGELCKNG